MGLISRVSSRTYRCLRIATMLRSTRALLKKVLPFDTFKQSTAGYYKPVLYKDLYEQQKTESLILEAHNEKSHFDQSSWSFSRREHIEYEGVPYNRLPVVRVQVRRMNLVFAVWTVNKRNEFSNKFQGEWRGDNLVWNNPYWRRMPIKRINSEATLPFMHRPELFWSMHKSGYLLEHQRREMEYMERTTIDFASRAKLSGKLNSDYVRVIVQGYGKPREKFVPGLVKGGLKIASITDDTRSAKRHVGGHAMHRPSQQSRKVKGITNKINRM